MSWLVSRPMGLSGVHRSPSPTRSVANLHGMPDFRRLLAGLAFVALAVLAFVPTGRAQAPVSARFAFADTSLLRDTLGLKFDRLFETADSLRMLPDSLRAQMIRYRLPMSRLLVMADSMGMPVDSVGVIIARERFNPLAAAAVTSGSFRYTSGYNIAKTTTVWSNGGDFQLNRGRMILRNGTNIVMDRSTAGGRVSLRQTRESTTEANWRTSPMFSVGGRALITGFDAFDPNSTDNQGETKSEFQLSTRTRQQWSRQVTSDLNMFAGTLNLRNFGQVKRGFSGDVNGRLRVQRGQWLSHDLSGGVNGNLSRTGRPNSDVTLGTHDLAATLRGTAQIFQAAPVSANVNYSARRSTVETPTEADTVSRLLTSGYTVDATLRLRLDNDRFLNLSGNAGTSTSLTGMRDDMGFRAQARWAQGLWALDADYSHLIRDSEFLRRATSPAYRDDGDDNTASGQLTRPFGRRFTTKLSGNISLSQARPTPLEPNTTPPTTPRDTYRQSYRIEGVYTANERLNSGLALEVGLFRSINLPASSTSNNTDTRSYRGEWRWSYRLMRGLTASQTNTIVSDYQFYPFAPERNTLSLDYNAVTNLNAVITPRLSVELSHNARQQPSGDWRTFDDGTGALLPSIENTNYTLRSRVTWSPSPAFSVFLTPEYQASDRTGTVNGSEAPTRTSRRLNFSGAANLNIPVGRRGQLTGTVGRTFTSDRTTTYQQGEPLASPLAEQDYWNGSLQFSWEI